MKVMCIFVSWNSERFIEDSVGRLHRFLGPHRILLVDNGSIDGTVAIVRERYPDVIVHELPVNTGFAGGNNYGIRAAVRDGYEAVFLLNVDTIIEEDIIAPCVKILEAHPEVGVVGPVVLEAFGKDVIQCQGARLRPVTLNFDYLNRGGRYVRSSGITDVGYVLGAAMMIRTSVFDKLGGFDEDYFPAYVEEADFCYRARTEGYRCVISLGSTVRHIGEQSSRRLKAFQRISTHRFYFAVQHSKPLPFLVGSALVVARVFYWKCRAALIKQKR